MSITERTLGGPEIEVVAKATRRRFTLEYNRKIVREADGCKTPGAVGALLRREGLYSSHLATWRAARERGELAGPAKKRGRGCGCIHKLRFGHATVGGGLRERRGILDRG